jgi:ribonuclease HI
MSNLICFCDGGFNNVTKSNGYGSFRIYTENSDIIVRNTFDFVHSSNEAEYQTLISMLSYILENYPEDSTILVYSDSKLMVNQINSIWQVNSPSLKDYYNIAIYRINKLNGFTLIWSPRKVLVKELGH